MGLLLRIIIHVIAADASKKMTTSRTRQRADERVEISEPFCCGSPQSGPGPASNSLKCKEIPRWGTNGLYDFPHRGGDKRENNLSTQTGLAPEALRKRAQRASPTDGTDGHASALRRRNAAKAPEPHQVHGIFRSPAAMGALDCIAGHSDGVLVRAIRARVGTPHSRWPLTCPATGCWPAIVRQRYRPQ
jgi:hypothetical protein